LQDLILDEKSDQTSRQIRDFVFYLSGSLVLAVIAIVRLPVFTTYFSPSEYGIFSLVSITYTYLSVAFYNWIASCLYRFFNEYTEIRQQSVLYSNIVFLFIGGSIVLLVVSVIWYSLAAGSAVRKLVIPAFCYLFTNQVFSFFLVIDKLKGKSLKYNLYQIIQAGTSFLMILLLIFRTDMRIEAIFTGQIIVNVILLGILTTKNRTALLKISANLVSFTMIRKLIQYGFIGFVSSAGIFILITSDRYIIALYEDISRVGIYNQVYQAGQVSVYFLVTVFFNAITPGFNKLLTGFTRDREMHLLNYINAFIILVLPVTFYVSIFSEQVAGFLLGPAFRNGYTMLPWIVISSFIYGLTLFSETRMKFDNRFKPVVMGVLLACILNVGLNFILVPRLGYTWAAVTTCIAYMFLFIFYYRNDDFKFLRNPRLIRIVLVSSAILILQGILDLLVRRLLPGEVNKWLTLLEAAIFFAVYVFTVVRLKLITSIQIKF